MQFLTWRNLQSMLTIGDNSIEVWIVSFFLEIVLCLVNTKSSGFIDLGSLCFVKEKGKSFFAAHWGSLLTQRIGPRRQSQRENAVKSNFKFKSFSVNIPLWLINSCVHSKLSYNSIEINAVETYNKKIIKITLVSAFHSSSTITRDFAMLYFSFFKLWENVDDEIKEILVDLFHVSTF